MAGGEGGKNKMPSSSRPASREEGRQTRKTLSQADGGGKKEGERPQEGWRASGRGLKSVAEQGSALILAPRSPSHSSATPHWPAAPLLASERSAKNKRSEATSNGVASNLDLRPRLNRREFSRRCADQTPAAFGVPTTHPGLQRCRGNLPKEVGGGGEGGHKWGRWWHVGGLEWRVAVFFWPQRFSQSRLELEFD